MNVELLRFEVMLVSMPFRLSFGHASASRSSSDNVIVKATTRDGVAGFGECVPRDYVTGETPADTARFIAEQLAPALLGRVIEQFSDAADELEKVYAAVPESRQRGAARCGFELAVLDAVSRQHGRSIGEFLGGTAAPSVTYSGVFPFLPAPVMLLAGALHRLYGIRTAKLKVGRSLTEDLRNLKILRATLGPEADLRVDANCGWGVDEAISAIRAMRRYGVKTIEQPVAREDFEGLKRVADAVEEPIMADESLSSLDDALQLAEGRMVDMFNVRISKCGGLLGARAIADIGARFGLTCQLGAHPGESAILTAAGRHFASRVPGLRYAEGSAGTILLKRDLAVERMVPGRGGIAPVFTGPGLGITILEERLEPLTRKRYVVD